jgi:adenosylhomocysteine nucleosidase
MADHSNESGPAERFGRQASLAWKTFLTRHQGCGPVGRLAKPPVDLLICFAVVEEMKFFSPYRSGALPLAGTLQVWMTGIGRKNAAENIRDAIARVRPERVITAGFAGGLNPDLKCGTVVYEQDFDAGFGQELDDLGAVHAKFHCHRRVAITAAEKAALWKETGADAVEMESSVIRTICKEFRIPSATIRVISDDASQDLPLDFNALMTSEDRINYLKLFAAVVSRPGRIPKLIEFQQQTLGAARRLDAVLEELLRAERC